MEIGLHYSLQLMSIFSVSHRISHIGMLKCLPAGMEMSGVSEDGIQLYFVKIRGASYTCDVPTMVEFYPKEVFDLLGGLTFGDYVKISADKVLLEAVVYKSLDPPRTVALSKANTGPSHFLHNPDPTPQRILTFEPRVLNEQFAALLAASEISQLTVDDAGLWIQDRDAPLKPLSISESTEIIRVQFRTRNLINAMLPVSETVQLRFMPSPTHPSSCALSVLYDEPGQGMSLEIVISGVVV